MFQLIYPYTTDKIYQYNDVTDIVSPTPYF